MGSTGYITDSTRGTSSNVHPSGCTSGGVNVPCIYTHASCESYRRRLGSLLSLCLRCVFRALINSGPCVLILSLAVAALDPNLHDATVLEY